MKNGIAYLFQKKAYLAAILLVFLVGIFLRTYNFSDWLHFELDQSRDAKVVDLAIERGIGNLPLLGPKAAGSFLRLGPAFYNMEYLSALLFGNTPSGIAIISLLLSILTIPVLFYFLREYFDRKISLGLTFLFSVSIFFVMYSRFAWNPNNLPFFILLSFYSILKASREGNHRGWWLMCSAVSLAMATQLHFVAFLAMPAIISLFLLITRPKIRLKFWLASIALIIFLYAPVIINDFKTGGENIMEFRKLFVKTSSENEHAFPEKLIRNFSENSTGHFLMLTGNGQAQLPKFQSAENLKCDSDCMKNLHLGIFSALFFAFGAILLLMKAARKNPDNFILLNTIWFSLAFILFLPIAYDLAPRFLLLISGLPFVFLGLLVEKIPQPYRYKIFFVLVLVLGVLNLNAIRGRFLELKKAPYEAFNIQTDKILKEKYRVTLEQQKMIADEMEKRFRENNFPVYVNSEPFYRRSFLYLLEEKKIPRDDFRNTQLSKKIYRNGNYFLIFPSLSNISKKTAKYLVNYEIMEEKNFGTLKMFRLEPREGSINDIEQIFGPKGNPTSAPGVPVRCRWNEILKVCNSDGLEDENGEAEDE